jgi:integrase
MPPKRKQPSADEILATLAEMVGHKTQRHPGTLSQFAEEFLGVYATTNNKPSEIASKKAILQQHLLPMFGKRRLDTLKPVDFEQYKARKLAEELSPKSVNNHLAVLSKLLRVAEEWELIGRAPRVKLLRLVEPEFTFFDFGETERLLGAADDEARPPILFALRTGLRQGELRALRPQDVDFAGKKIYVRRAAWRNVIGVPKSWRSRELPLADDAARAIEPLPRGQFVFAHPTGRIWHHNELKWRLFRTCKRAGLKPVGWHVLRHTFASHLVMRGVPIKVVQELLGHRDIRMTMRYAHLAPALRKDAVEALSRPPPEWARTAEPEPEDP